MSRIDERPSDLETVRDILRKHVPNRRVVAFGSRTTGRCKPFSDLDLAVLGDESVPSVVLAALAEDFDESSLPFKVDLVDWATTAQSFRAIIARDAVIVQEAASVGEAP